VPLIPRGLTPSFVQRIQDGVRNLRAPGGVEQVVNRTVDRVKREINDRLPGGGGQQTDFAGGGDIPMPPIPSDVGDVMARIARAGAQWRILRVRYHDTERDLEPYSFRYRDADDPHIPLLYAYCHKDEATEAFKLKKFQSITITNRTYGPIGAKWDNEFARRR
jgi:hypothetical protein